MARDIYTVPVLLTIRGTDRYKIRTADDWDEHFHHNTNRQTVLKQVKAALKELGLDCKVEVGDVDVEIEMTPTEEKALDADRTARDADWQEMSEKVYALGEELGTRFSCWSMGAEQKLLDNEIFHTGKCIIEYDGGWGDGGESEVLINPTYQDAWKVADRLMRLSGDGHHVFLEGLTLLGTRKGVQVFAVSTGS